LADLVRRSLPAAVVLLVVLVVVVVQAEGVTQSRRKQRPRG
jgi:hypothetical protein